MSSAPPYLDVLNQLLGRGVDRGLGVGHILNGTGPPGGLVEQLGVEPVAVLASVHGDVPVACGSSTHIIVSLLHQTPRNSAPLEPAVST